MSTCGRRISGPPADRGPIGPGRGGPGHTPAPVAVPAAASSEPANEQAYNPWFLIAIGAMIAVGITLLLMARAG